MSLSDLASLGGFVSGIAVMITLVLLLVQVMHRPAHIRDAGFGAQVLRG